MLINNPAIVPKPLRLFSNGLRDRLAAPPFSPDNQAMSPYHPLFIIPALAALLTLAPAQAASPAEGQEPVRHAVGHLEDSEQLLQQLGADAELITLNLEATGFHLVFHPAEAPVPSGNLLILPDMDAGQGWLAQGLAIARHLAEHGWNTLILQPPLPPEPELPERTLPSLKAIHPAAATQAADTAPSRPEGEEPATEETGEASAPGTPEPTLSFAEQMQQHLELAETELQQRSHPDTEINVILGIGHSAPWAAAFAVARGEDWDLVMVNPRSGPDDEASLISQLPLLKGRVIDLYYLPLPGYPEAAPDARLRRRLAVRHELQDYHQARLSGPFRGWQLEMPRLVRQLRGRMEHILLTPEEDEAAAPVEVQVPPGGRTALIPPEG